MWQNVTIEPWQAVMGLRGARSQFVVALNNARVLGRVTRKTLLLRLGGVGRMLGDVSEHLIALSLLIICVIVKSMILYVSASKQGSCITLSMESSTHKYVELSHGTDLDIISDLCNWSTSPAFVKVITTIRTWKRDLGRLKINMAADRDAKPPTLTDMPSSAMLTDMSSSAIVAAAGDASGADLPMICSINFHNSEAVNKALHWLLDKRAYTENNTHAVAEAWSECDDHAITYLSQCGVVSCRFNELGHRECALNMSRIQLTPSFTSTSSKLLVGTRRGGAVLC